MVADLPDDWWSELFAGIDAKNADRFASFLADDAEFRFGNGPIIHGIPMIKEAVTAFFDTIDRSDHQLIRTWADDEARVCQGSVTYTRLDQSRITLPFVNVFEMSGTKIARYLIYVDVGPLYSHGQET